MNQRNFLNWASLGFVSGIFPEIASLVLSKNQLLTKSVIAQPVLTTAEVIKKIQNICFGTLGKTYKRPNTVRLNAYWPWTKGWMPHSSASQT